MQGILYIWHGVYNTNRTVLIKTSDCKISHPGRPSFVVFTPSQRRFLDPKDPCISIDCRKIRPKHRDLVGPHIG